MNKEEKEAIERLDRKLTSEKFTKNIGMPVYIKDVETVLNLIQKQEEEIKRLKEDISNMYDEKVVINILEDECGLSKYEIDEILN